MSDPLQEAVELNFEHLIQINDPLNPLVASMTREQLWEGLVLRAEQPQLFVLGLDSCTILSRTGSTMERELHYGQATVRDRVTLTPNESVRYDILATEAHVDGSLTMMIEQPDARQLFLRFEYRTTLPTADNEDATDRRDREVRVPRVRHRYGAADPPVRARHQQSGRVALSRGARETRAGTPFQPPWPRPIGDPFR